jgi:DNA-binding PadR family transcriptional regulator
LPADYTIKEIKSKIIKEFLNLIVLIEMNRRESISGYDIIDLVRDKFDETISPGTAYSTLYAMERKSLIYGQSDGRKTVYKLTEKGQAVASILINAQKDLAAVCLKIYN